MKRFFMFTLLLVIFASADPWYIWGDDGSGNPTDTLDVDSETGIRYLRKGKTLFQADTTGTLKGKIGTTATLTVAAYNSSEKSKNRADYVCDGTDDRIEINTAIYSCAPGGKIQLMEGTYNAHTIILKDSITLQGVGWGTVLRLPDSTQKNIIGDTANPRPDTLCHVQIKDIQFDGNLANLDTAWQKDGGTILEERLCDGIFLRYAQHVDISGCYFHDFLNLGILVYDSCLWVNVHNNTFKKCSWAGVEFWDYIYNSTITDNHCDNASLKTEMDESEGIAVSDNVVIYPQAQTDLKIGNLQRDRHGVSIRGGHQTCSNNVLIGAYIGCIVSHSVISGNVVNGLAIKADTGTSYNLAMYKVSTGDNNVVIGNYFYNAINENILLNGVRNIQITGNYCDSVFKNNKANIVMDSCQQIVISNNLLRRCPSDSSILGTGTTDSCIINCNFVDGTFNGLGSNSIIYDNINFNQWNTQTPAENFSATSTIDTVLVAGLPTGARFSLTWRGTTEPNKPLWYNVTAGTLFVRCSESDTAKARSDGYNWRKE